MNYYLKRYLCILAAGCGINTIFSAQEILPKVDLNPEIAASLNTAIKKEGALQLADEILASAKNEKQDEKQTIEFVALADKPIVEMPRAWQERPDVFNPQADILNILKKTKISGSISVVNRTSASIKLVLASKGEKSADDSWLEVAAGKYKDLTLPASINSVESISASPGFVNVIEENGKVFLTIEEKQALIFPRPLAPFGFIPDLIASEKLSKQVSEKDVQKIKEYIGHVGYFRWCVARDEWVRDAKVQFERDGLYLPFYKQRQELFEKNKIENLLDQPLPKSSRIQQNLFAVWLTAKDKPVEPKDEYIDLILRNASVNPVKDGWNQYLVVQDFVLKDADLFKNTRKRLEGSGVQLTSYEKLIGRLELQDSFDSIVSKKRFAMASDLLRVEIIHKLGGAYLDIDLLLNHSLKPLFFLYDSLFGIEPMSEFVGNAFMAASAGHPIAREMLDLMARNFKYKAEGKTEFYSSSVVDENDGFNTILQTGPCVTTVAFFNKADMSGGRRDLLAPPELFYPAVSLKRPESKIPGISDPVGIGAATLHLWRTTWAGDAGKENGCKG